MNYSAEQKEHGSWWLRWYGDSPQDTRERILYCAFKEVHLNGFQAASIQNITQSAGITKGALYHHFSSKNDIGYALLDEIFTQYIDNAFIAPLVQTDDPITALVEHLQQSTAAMRDEDVALGCPLDRFSQEMAPLDSEFQKRIDSLFKRKNEALVAALRRGQLAGNVTTDVAAESIAMMIEATLQGCMGMAKHAHSLHTLTQCCAGLFHYMEQLRPPK